MIYCITVESQSMDMKLIEIKLCNGTYVQQFSIKITNSEVKVGTLHVNNMKSVETRYEVLENMSVIENFAVDMKIIK